MEEVQKRITSQQCSPNIQYREITVLTDIREKHVSADSDVIKFWVPSRLDMIALTSCFHLQDPRHTPHVTVPDRRYVF
jgi:hypothetical protein